MKNIILTGPRMSEFLESEGIPHIHVSSNTDCQLDIELTIREVFNLGGTYAIWICR